MFEFFRKFERCGIKIAGVNTFLSPNLSIYFYLLYFLYGAGGPLWSKAIFGAQLKKFIIIIILNCLTSLDSSKPIQRKRECLKTTRASAHLLLHSRNINVYSRRCPHQP